MNAKDLFPAIVKDNNDSKQEGRVQIFIETFMSGYNPSHYPWARPFNMGTGGSASHGVSNIPEKDSKVWVFFEEDEFKKKPRYLADVDLESFNPHKLFDTSSAKTTMGIVSGYPDIKFKMYANGIITGVSSNTTNPEIFMYHPSGSYFYFDKNGDIVLKAGAADLEKTLLGETVKAKIDAILDAIISHIHPTGVGPSLGPTNAADFTVIKTNLSEILSDQIKNN